MDDVALSCCASVAEAVTADPPHSGEDGAAAAAEQVRIVISNHIIIVNMSHNELTSWTYYTIMNSFWTVLKCMYDLFLIDKCKNAKIQGIEFE